MVKLECEIGVNNNEWIRGLHQSVPHYCYEESPLLALWTVSTRICIPGGSTDGIVLEKMIIFGGKMVKLECEIGVNNNEWIRGLRHSVLH